MSAKARAKYADFHGRSVQKERLVRFIQPQSLVFLGKAIAIEYRCNKINGTPEGGEGDMATYRHEFDSSDILCTDESGHQLYILGPSLRVTTRGIIN